MNEPDLSQYIICRENCTLQFLEALAMNGLAAKAYVEDCERRNFQRIVLELFNGEKVTSNCEYVEEVEQSIRIINVYIGLNRRNNSWNKISIE